MSVENHVNTVLGAKRNKSDVVGMGDAYATCGGYVGRSVCPTCGHTKVRKKYCRRWSCPVCWPSAVAQAIRRIRPRLACIPESYGDWKHWVIYPPRSGLLGYTAELADRSASDVYKLYLPVLRMMLGVYGVLVLHPYKMSDLGKAAVQAWRDTHPRSAYIPPDPPRQITQLVPTWHNVPLGLLPPPQPVRPRGSWMILHEIGIRQEYLQSNPHFHLVTRGSIPEWISDEMIRQGWFVRRVRDLRDVDDACGLVRYLLSHAAYDERGKVYRYVLPIGYKFKRTGDGMHYELVHCDNCGDVMRYADASVPDTTMVSDLPQSAVPVYDTTCAVVRGATPVERLYLALRRNAYKIRDRR